MYIDKPIKTKWLRTLKNALRPSQEVQKIL